jgi:hypothetical protein
MGRHRTPRSRTGRRIAGLVTAVLAVAGLVFAGATTASAGTLPIPLTTNASVSTTDGWHAKCAFSVKSVNHTTFVVTGHIGAVATVKSNSAWANNVFTQVTCDLFDPNFALLDSATFQADGPTLPQSRVLVQEPYFSSYIVCITALVKQHNGNTSGPLHNCSNS